MDKNDDHIEQEAEDPSRILDSTKPLYEIGGSIGGKPGRGKAIVDTALEFLGVIYQTLKNDCIFEDFPDSVTLDT